LVKLPNVLGEPQLLHVRGGYLTSNVLVIAYP